MFKRKLLIASVLTVLSHASPALAEDDGAAKGEKIFKEVCARCHTADAEGKLGPGLKGITQRRDEQWLDQWIKSPKEMIASGDLYATRLREENKYDLTMPTLPVMQKDENRKAVIAYLKTL